MAVHYVEGDELRESVWIEIRTVLMEHWDPAQACGEPFATDEYESYIPKIKALLRARSSVETLIDYLDWIETKRMGFPSQSERGRKAAEMLLTLASQLSPLE